MRGKEAEAKQNMASTPDAQRQSVTARFSAQAAATLSTDNVMMASSRAFASDAAGASASPPSNAGGSAPAVSLGSSVGVAYENGTEVAADVVVDTQVQQWGYIVYGAPRAFDSYT